MAGSSAHDLSNDPSVIRSLTAQQKQRLTDLLDEYLRALEDGLPPNTQQLLENHPDLAKPLTEYLKHLEALHNAAAGFAGPNHSPLASPDGSTLTTFAADSPVLSCEGQQLGDFLLRHEIGRGGMGVVYEADQLSLGRRVAIKLLPFAAVLDAKQIARFKNEAQAAAQIQHPHIVPVYAIGVDRGVHYYAMQLIDGQPLDRVIQDRLAHRTPQRNDHFRTVTELGVQIASALHAAHEYGVVHRDVKPSNVLLDHQGKAWITDFGLARCQEQANITGTGELVGTMRYMSPEQAAGQSAFIDHRTDIYSLSATLYELLTLHAAFEGDNGPHLLRRIETDEPLSPRVVDPRIPVDLATVISKGMSKARDERYATARELADDLQRFLDGRPTIAKPPSLPQRLLKWTRRHRSLVTTVAIVAGLLLSMLSLSTILIARANSQAKLKAEEAAQHDREKLEAVDRFVIRWTDELQDDPRAHGVRSRILKDALELYQSYARSEETIPELRARLGETLRKIAGLQARLGQPEQALDSYLTAIAHLTDYCQDHPAAMDVKKELASCHTLVATLYGDQAKSPEAETHFAKSLEICNELMKEMTDPAEIQAEIASVQNNLALLQSRIGRLDQALVTCEQALQLQTKLVRQFPESIPLRTALARTHNNLHGLLAPSQLIQAQDHAAQAMQIYQQLAQEQPDKLEYQHKIALMHGNIGALQAQQKLDQQAEQSQRQAVEMLSQVVAADAQTKVYHSDLALAYNNLGRVQAARGSDVSAIESYQKAIAGLSELIRRYPGDINDISNLGGMYNNLAMTLRTLDQLESAATALEKAIELQRQAYEAAPEVGQFRAFLNNHYYNYGELLREAGRVDEAVKVAFQRKSLQPAEPEQCASVADEVARSAQQLHLQSPTSPTARRYYSEARTLYQQAAAKGWKAPATGRQHESLEMLIEFFGSVDLPEGRAASEADVP